MDPSEPSPRPPRETFLGIMLGGFVLFGALFFLVFVSAGGFLWVLAGVGAIALFAGIHYLLWGWRFSQSTAGEREEAQLREAAERDGGPLPDPRRPSDH